MAINYELLNKGGISLGTNFELLSEKPLDSRLVVPSLEGLQNYIDNAAAYEGMIVYDQTTKKTYQVQTIEGVLSYREFGINEAELKDLIASETTAAMEFKGVAATLPENPAKGDMYKVAGENIDITIDDVEAQVGDAIVYNGEQWFLIPSGDDIEDTWRPVTDVDNDATLTFVAGDKLDVAVAADGTITYKHETIDAPTDVTAEGDEKTRTYITAVETDGHGHITGYKTATENVEDTNTEYAFEGQAEESNVYFQVTPDTEGADTEVVYLDAYSKNEADKKLTDAIDAVKVEVANQDAVVLSEAQKYADGKDAAIQAAQKTADDAQADITAYKASNNEALAGVKATAEAAATKEYADAELAKKVDKVDGKGLSTNDLTDELKGQYDTAYAHSQVAHAPADAQANILESVKVNGEALTITDKAVDITVPTGALAGKDEVTKDDLAEALATEIDNKVVSVAAGDASVTVGGTATAPTVATKISAAEGNALTLAEDGLKVIIPESTKVEASETNGNIKVDGEEVTVYTHPDKHAIADVTGLQDAIDGLSDRIGSRSFEHPDDPALSYDASGVYIDIEAIEAEIDQCNYNWAELNEWRTGNNVPGDSIDDRIAANAAAIALKADKSVVDAMYTNDAIDTAVQGAKDYAKGLVDAIPAQTDYTVTITESTDGLDAGVAKKYTFTQNGAEIGTINLAKDLVVTAGSVKEVTEAGKPYADAVVGDKYIELVIANQDAPIYVPAKDLVDIYTAKAGADEVQVAISNTNEISATLTDAVKEKINKAHTHTFVEAELNKIADGDVAKWNAAEQNAKDYTDDEIEKLALGTMSKEAADDYVKKTDATGYGDILTKTEAQSAYQAKGEYYTKTEADAAFTNSTEVDGQIDAKIEALNLSDTYVDHTEIVNYLSDYAATGTLTVSGDATGTVGLTNTADNGIYSLELDVTEAAHAEEATKATQDGNGKVIADTYAEKATTLAGYNIDDAYTKAEINDLFTWGSF